MRVAVTMAMLVLALGAAPAHADETILAPTAFNVDGGSVTTPALEAGAEYRLESGGTFQDVGPNVTFDHDAAYCYGDNNPQPICTGDPSPSSTGLWARYVGSDARPFYELEGTVPAYAANHGYYTRFTATQDAPLQLLANTPELGHQYPGQLAVALYKVSSPGTCTRGLRRACNDPEAFFPLDEEPRPGQKVFYPRPEVDFPVRADGPRIGKRVKSASVDIESATQSVDIYALSADEDTIVSAFYICHVFMPQRDLSVLFGSLAQVVDCTAAIAAVLQRCRKLKQKRGGPGICGGPEQRGAHAAAAGGCETRWFDPTKGGRKTKLKMRCRRTAGGLRFTLKPKRKRNRLRKLLGKHPNLMIGSAYPGSEPSTVAVTWHLKH